MDFDFTPMFETVEILDRTYYVRALWLDELADYEKRSKDADGMESVVDFLSLVLCDDKGERITLPKEWRIPLPVALKLKRAALKLNGLTGEEDDAGKAPSSSSRTP